MSDKEKVLDLLVDYEQLTTAQQEAVLQKLVEKKYERTLQERVGLEKKKFIGRPSKMQPEVIERLLMALRQGASINMACKFAGISSEIFSIWAKRAREYQDALMKVTKRELEYEATYQATGEKFKLTPSEKRILEKPTKDVIDAIELFVLIDQAIAECGVRDLASISKAANNGAWTAAAFRLSKRFPQEYGARAEEQAQINVNVGFGYVEINKALPNRTREDIRRDEDNVARQIEQGVIDVESRDIN